MSKKKSLTHHRRTKGHISKGVVNYTRVEQMGQTKPRLRKREIRILRAEREIVGLLDAARQREEQDLNWDLIALILKYNPGLTLEQVKAQQIELRRLHGGTNDQ